MRKGIACLLALAMLLMTFGAAAEGLYTMAGFDGDGVDHDWDTNLFFQRMEEKTGVGFEFQQVTDYQTWLLTKAAYASGKMPLPDVLFKAGLNTQEMQAWLSAGKIIDLKPYLEQYAPNLTALLKANPDWEKAITLPSGEIPALPYINELQNNNAMWINTQWLENLKLEVPTTAEELTEVLRAFKAKDPNVNGDDDEKPVSFLTMWDLKFLGHAFGLVGNDYNAYVDETGTVQTTLTSEKNRAFLTWLHRLWEEDLLDHSGFSSADTLRAITDEEAPMTYGLLLAPTPLTLIPGTSIGQYDLLMPMTYEGKQIYRDLTGDIIRGTFAITSACKDPAALVSWVDYLYTEEGFILSEAGVADEEFYWNDDGTWLWDSASDSMISTVLADSTIRSGISMPGYSSIPFQQKIDDASTQFIVNSLLRLKGYDELPYPMVYLTEEQQSRVDELILNISRYAEYQMVWFVAGDVELNDENWQTFCKTVKELGMDEMVSIWQTAADTQR